ncbi:MAG: polysaccharide biosynthesis tyrosine autokinase [Bacteroidetes bacterium]|nr:polysaccharide biosynthesis tyrosine autokinase [Bacteroidota bacterium]HET6243606.1 polysaccharide biosynthesis tyrosine autokinase [Bacteroidia bacterium]
MYTGNLHDDDNLGRYKERLSNFSKEFEFGLFLIIIRKNLIWLATFIFLAALCAFIYLRYTPPIYEASSIIQVNYENNASKVLGVDNLHDQQDISREIELLRSKLFLKQALTNLPLNVAYFNQGTVLEFEQYTSSPYTIEIIEHNPAIEDLPIFIDFYENGKTEISYQYGQNEIKLTAPDNKTFELPHCTISVTVNNPDAIKEQILQNKKERFFFKISNIDNITRTYMGKLEVKLLNSAAKTIQIIIKDNNPEKCADIVNAITEEYLKYEVERKSESAINVLAFIDTQIEGVYGRLKESETSIQVFKTENKLANDKDFISLNIEKFSSIESEILELELNENMLKTIEKRISESSSEIDIYKLLPLFAGTQYEGTSINKLISRLHELLLSKELALFDETPNSGNIKTIDYQIKIQKKLLIESIQSLSKKTTEKKNNLIAKTLVIEESFLKAPLKEVEFARLQRHFSINEKFYNLLMEKRTEYSILKASFIPQNLILDRAYPPSMPFSPNKSIIFTACLLVGLLMGIALILTRYLIHNDIDSLNEIVRHSNASIGILGIIPKYKDDIPVSQLIVNKNPKSLIAEAFRSIRTNLQFISNETGPKVIAISSTISGEGKTFTALNLGGIIAFSEKKVIIIDLDMRKPKIHKGFNSPNEIGMSTILIGKHTIEECIRNSTMKNLDFITAGPIPPNPSELIISNNMDLVIEKLKSLYDVVIIDNPPVGLVTDGISIFQKADYPIYVFRSEYSKKNFIHNADRLVNENKITKLSVILNGVDIDKSTAGYGYGYGYGYGSNYGYYDEEKKPSKKTILQRLFNKQIQNIS